MKNTIFRIAVVLILFFVQKVSAQQSSLVLSQREQAVIIDEVLDDRLKNLLPGYHKSNWSS